MQQSAACIQGVIINYANKSSNCTGYGPGNLQRQFYVSHGDRTLQTLCAIAVPVLVALGLLGNACSLVLLRESAGRVTGHFYLCCLSVLDSLTLVSILLSVWLGVILPGYYFVWFSEVPAWLQAVTGNCALSQFRVYASFYCRMVSVWTVAILSVERAVAVISPLKWGPRLCTVRNGVKAVATLLVVAAPFNIYAIFGFDYNQLQGTCRPNVHFYVGSVLSNVMFSLVPWCVICVANCLLVATMRGRGRRTSLQLDKRSADQQEFSVTVRLFVVSLAFLVFTLPLGVMSAVHSSYELHKNNANKTGPLADLWLASFVLFTANFAANFVLYCLTGRNFRLAAAALLTCRLGRMRRLRLRLDRRRFSAVAAIDKDRQHHEHEQQRLTKMKEEPARVPLSASGGGHLRAPHDESAA